MKPDPIQHLTAPAVALDGATDQFRLVRMQIFNWGTFSGVADFPIPEEGYLFVGPSGSGKSTLLDANAALMTPPKWAAFNVAAREAERGNKDRNVLTYVRGAWAQQTGKNGEVVAQYLRPDTTWSALAETYRNAQGRVVVLAQVLWVRGKSTSAADVKRHFLVLEREFDVRELQFLPEHDFDVRRFKFDLPDAFARDEFSAYQERFRRLMGIDSDRALRLLHKTQSAKNLGDLNEFLRDFMLDPPQTFELAERLVTQFQELDEAHRAVVTARRQVEVLAPAREEADRLDAARRDKAALDALTEAVDPYCEQQRQALLAAAIASARTECEGLAQEELRLEDLAANEYAQLRTLEERRAGMGGSQLERLAEQLRESEAVRDKRLGRREQLRAACAVMAWATPDTPVAFAQRQDEAGRYVLDERAQSDERDERKFELKSRQRTVVERLAQTRQEVAALERQRSNIPARMLAVREKLARELGIAEEKLPFAGELIEVRPEHARWQGAIERVLHGFALSLLVEERYAAQVAALVNAAHSGERVVYFRMQDQAGGHRVGADALVHKLAFAPTPQADWVREHLKAHFDYDCVGSVAALHHATRAVTCEGQVKHSNTRHEKNDRHRVDDRSRWVLGFDNADKLALFQKTAHELVVEHEQLRQDLEVLEGEASSERTRQRACLGLANLSWDEVDVDASLAKIAALQAQITSEREAHPDLDELDRSIARQRQAHQDAMQAKNGCTVRKEGVARRLAERERKYDGLRPDLLAYALTPHQQEGLAARFGRASAELTLDNLAGASSQVERALNAEDRELSARITASQQAMERRFAEFVRTWPAEAGGLDASVASAPDFFAKLVRLETDGLPQYESRFLALLREQSDQNLTRLATQLDYERKAIRDRMGLVNDSLAGAPFNRGTHLVIETQDKLLADVVAFKQKLKASLSHSLSADPALAEQRFGVLHALVKRFASQETADRNWRALVLDVRQHVEFVARELDQDGLEVEVYRSGAGKSGGQRQKLAATCLAAALRYQLGGQDRAMPQFSTVFLDEAFDKADAEFTTMAMNIFRNFGFQMIVATPLKSVMTLEPFIGGACFIHIKDRKVSYAVEMPYDRLTRRLQRTDELLDAEKTAAA